jgi:putative addiction module killer protein
MKVSGPLRVLEYVNSRGLSPFRQWLDALNIETKARVQARIQRLETGSMGDYKSVGEGILELRLSFGPGYRVYFAFDSKTVVLLLTGGDKGNQRKDIKRAQQLWVEYLRRS